MLGIIRDIFNQAADADPSITEKRQHMAAAILLFEVAKADHNLGVEEQARLERVLREEFDLAPDALEELVVAAHGRSEEVASLHEQVDLINEMFDRDRKLALLTDLWRVACADGVIHHHEEHLIRRLSDLMHLNHRDFIRAKHNALGEGGE